MVSRCELLQRACQYLEDEKEKPLLRYSDDCRSLLQSTFPFQRFLFPINLHLRRDAIHEARTTANVDTFGQICHIVRVHLTPAYWRSAFHPHASSRRFVSVTAGPERSRLLQPLVWDTGFDPALRHENDLHFSAVAAQKARLSGCKAQGFQWLERHAKECHMDSPTR